MGRSVGFKSQKTPDLQRFCPDYASTHKVLGIGIHVLQEREAKANQLGLGLGGVHGKGCLENLLTFLRRSVWEKKTKTWDRDISKTR